MNKRTVCCYARFIENDTLIPRLFHKMKNPVRDFWFQHSPHRHQMQLRPDQLCPISLKTLMVKIQLVAITMMRMKNEASHLRICRKDSEDWFELQDFGLYPWHTKTIVFRENGSKLLFIAKNQISHLWCTDSYKIAAPDKLSSLVKSTSSVQASWIRMLVAPARSVAGHLVTSSMFLSWSHMQALPAKAQRINDSCT